MTGRRRVLTPEEFDAMLAAVRDGTALAEVRAASGRCPRCGGELVEVDNPVRREVRHRRGQECR